MLAVTPWTRSKGLLGRSGLDPDEGLWIQPTGSIHMWFMRFPIDVVYADRDGRVLKLVHAIRPWRMSACRGAKVALELLTDHASHCVIGAAPGEQADRTEELMATVKRLLRHG